MIQFLNSLLLLVLITSPIAAQVDEKAKAQEKLERQKELERQALVLVDEVATGAQSLKLPENRSYVLATTADLLWDHDEKRARALFWESLHTLNIVLATQSKNVSRNESTASYLDRKSVV